MKQKMYVPVIIILLMTATALINFNCTKKMEPPIAKVIAHLDTVLGRELVDNYFWLRERDNPDVIAYLEAENEYTASVMKHTVALQEKIYEELIGRIKETDLTVPYRKGDYFYYSRTEEGQQYEIYCRKHDSLEAKEEILLDLNLLAEGKEFLSLGTYRISPNSKLLAYAIDETGSERYTLRIKNLETGELLPDKIDSVDTDLEWANDNKTIFYCIYDEAWRPYKMYRHKLGDSQTDDVLVYHEKDDAFWLAAAKTKSDKYLLMVMGNKTTREYRYLDADNPTGQFKIIHPRQHNMKYFVEHSGDKFYIRTNDNNSINYKIVTAPVSNPLKKNWKELIAHYDSVTIDNIEIFEKYMALFIREGGLQQIRIMELKSGKTYDIDFPEKAYSVWSGDNFEFKSDILRYNYESMISPESVYDYNMTDHQSTLKKQKEILGGFKSEDYATERLFAPTDDGVMVPLTIVYKKGMVKNGRNPLYLYGYGAYGTNYDPYFSSNRLTLLNRGFIFVLAHVRGGGVMGIRWYEDGKMLKKKNTFTDFIACAEYLIDEKYTSADKIVIGGGSAGGLLVGAVVNMRPDLFKAVVADVPFVDIINTMLDESIPLTVLEFEEWGNPRDKEYFDYMMSYSPYDNVEAKDYPNMLITGGLNDTRVQYWEPAKWTAKLRALKTDHNRVPGMAVCRDGTKDMPRWLSSTPSFLMFLESGSNIVGIFLNLKNILTCEKIRQARFNTPLLSAD